ncbi:hypothetical protein DITRI_Ditri01bG0106000 [Diplodiscus trichospermus]
MQEFVDCRNEIAVFDHIVAGPLFTWSNKHQEGFLARKLDQALINDYWEAIAYVEFLAPEVSDHCPALIQFKSSSFQPAKPFKFYNFWAKHSDFLGVVEESWKLPVKGNPMKILYNKLRRLKPELKKLNKAHFSDISFRVNQKIEELVQIQKQILTFATDVELVAKEHRLST